MTSKLLTLVTFALATAASPLLAVRDEPKAPKPAKTGFGGFGSKGSSGSSGASSSGGGLSSFAGMDGKNSMHPKTAPEFHLISPRSTNKLGHDVYV